ncbi:MAG: YHS domain-containing protein, partial [Bradyrhizobium sp.]|nr:YHS domain-containing protein [Bradyrhizobium sp.]
MSETEHGQAVAAGQSAGCGCGSRAGVVETRHNETAAEARCTDRADSAAASDADGCCGGHDHATPLPAKMKDPVCGMSVDPATSKHRFEHQGQTFHFCSAGCRSKFAADPAKYLVPVAAAGSCCAGHDHHAHHPDAATVIDPV